MGRRLYTLSSLAALFALLLVVALPLGTQRAAVVHAANRTGSATVTVGYSEHNDTSLPLREMGIIRPQPRPQQDHPEVLPVRSHVDASDTAVQREIAGRGAGAQAPGGPASTASGPSAATLGANFEGMSDITANCACEPPDTNGAIGPHYYVQIVNAAFQVFNRDGTSAFGPAAINTLWQGFGTVCEKWDQGDPVVTYDRLADRWVISQFAFPNDGSTGPYDECIAVSQTNDPTGAYYRYAFFLSNRVFPDYPKLGVWPNGYYMSVNEFGNYGNAWNGPQPYVFNRTAMLAGQSASFITTGSLGPNANAMLPADLDGATPPPTGSDEYFVSDSNTLDVGRFHTDWTTPSNSRFSWVSHLQTAGWSQICPSQEYCVPQKGTSQQLDSIGDRMMFRLDYRNMGSYQAMVVNRTVSVGGQAGIRWYEIHVTPDPAGTVSLFQQGTYAPSDGEYRWMASAALDKYGDVALGYSFSGSDTYPQIRVTGHMANDPAGQLTVPETTIIGGTAPHYSTYNRWGDYSDLTVDPQDDCTFWYTNEYYKTTQSSSSDYDQWHTRIASFRLPGCGGGQPSFRVQTGESATAGQPATVQVTALNAQGSVDSGYTGTVHVTSSDGQASLPTDYTFTAGDAGSHTFSVTFKTAGKQTITATDSAAASMTGQTSTSVAPAAAATLRLGAPTSAAQNNPFNVTVTALDAFNNVATSYTGTVHFSSNTDSTASLPADYAFTSSDNGTHTFSVTFDATGSQGLAVADTANPIGGTLSDSAGIQVNAVTVARFAVSAPSTATAGSSMSVTVTALDSNGNTVSSYTGTVHFSSSDTRASLPADYAFTGGDAGSHTFQVTLKTAGGQTVTVKDTAATAVTGSASTNVSPAPASGLTLTTPGLGTQVGAGAPFTLQVRATDPYNNIATGYAGTVRFSSTDSAATLPSSYTFAGADAGTKTFSATLRTSGPQTVTVTDGTLTTSLPLTVTAPPAATPFVLGVPRGGAIAVVWQAVASNATYAVTCSPSCGSHTTGNTSLLLQGLTNGMSYTVSVVTTKNGMSSPATSTTVSPTSLTLPYGNKPNIVVSSHTSSGTGLYITRTGTLPQGLGYYPYQSRGTGSIQGTVYAASGSFPQTFSATYRGTTITGSLTITVQ